MKKDRFLARLRPLELGPEVEELMLVFLDHDEQKVHGQPLLLLRFLAFQKKHRQHWDRPSLAACEKYLDQLRAHGYRHGTVLLLFSVVRCWLRFLYRQKRLLIPLYPHLP